MAAIRSNHDSLARHQLHAFDQLCQEISVSDDDRRKVLLLSPEEWSAWQRVRDGGPLPVAPDVPMMLLRLGSAAHRLSVAAERARVA